MEPYPGSLSPGPPAAACPENIPCHTDRLLLPAENFCHHSGRMITQDPRERVISVFNHVAAGYDNTALRFFPFCADRLVAWLNPAPGTKLLDVATGTGAVALAAAQAIGAQGRVMGIDLAQAMLDRLQEKIEKFGLHNIDLHVMDAAALDFRRDYFDAVVCSFGIFFLPDMAAGLGEWVRVTKPRGRVAFTVFGRRAFQPMMELFRKRLERYGVVSLSGNLPLAASRLADVGHCRDLLSNAGLQKIEVVTEQFGYHLKDETQWWDVLWNSGPRGWIEQLPSPEREVFKTEHLAEIRSLVAEDGLWLDVETHFAIGTKP
jgi:ubiquinone/menaquinone biosynthesis C-methylase UbiE